ncbi:MAG: hypothetical protein ACE5KM_13450 [Planctomycetaceae bacterium]
MTIGPILPGRLPSTLIAARLRQNIQRSSQILQRLQDQAATGQRFILPSEAPGAAARTILLQKIAERKAQMQVNLQTDKSLLAASESSLAAVSDGLVQGKRLLIAGAGDTASSTEKTAMADEIAGIIKAALNAANSKFRGRYLFGGSESQGLPFELVNNALVRYNGDREQINSFIDLDLLVSNNVDGVTAFNPLTQAAGGSINPAVTLNTRLSDLHGGAGVSLGPISITVNNGGPITQTVDLTNAETVGGVKTLIENAFAPGTLTVGILPSPGSSGLSVTPAAGTVAIADIAGATTARDLGIASAATAVINGGDIDPRLTLDTPLSAFNNGAGATTAGGLVVTNGLATRTIDISSATTVEDLFNLLKAENLDLELRINDAGDGLSVSGRLGGGAFAIGENGGTDATTLGIRTLTGATLLADLNFGLGVPVNQKDSAGVLLPAEIAIVRRDGTTSTIDLKGLTTVQQVMDTITAVDSNLTASLNSVGNGISITDASGTGPLQVLAGQVADALGITGTEPGTNNTVPLTGTDVGQFESKGVFGLLVQLENALRSDDQRTLERLDPLFDAEMQRINGVRGKLGSRLQLLETVENRLQDEDVVLQEQISQEFDADLAEVITQIAQVSGVLQATLQIASSTLNLTLLNFL